VPFAHSARPFRTERTLVQEYLRSKPASRHSPHSLFRREFDATNGRADIIHVKLRSNWRTKIALGRIHPRWAYALKSLPYRRVFSTPEFQELAGTTRGTALKVLRSFEKYGYCTRAQAKDSWRKKSEPQPIVREITSIEAKLGDWRRALAQAYRHLAFSGRSYVLLDRARAQSALKNLQAFRRLGIGLITLQRGRLPKTWIRPENRRPRSEIVFWYANAELARRLFFQVRGVVLVDAVKPRL